MYTGTLIDDLIATVELAEEQIQEANADDDNVYAFTPAPHELAPAESNLLGVA
jgi:hypothetical protein